VSDKLQSGMALCFRSIWKVTVTINTVINGCSQRRCQFAGPPLKPILSQFNPFHIFKIHPSRINRLSIPVGFVTKILLYSHLPLVLHTARQIQCPWFNYQFKLKVLHIPCVFESCKFWTWLLSKLLDSPILSSVLRTNTLPPTLPVR
jgi:hypothetical protein